MNPLPATKALDSFFLEARCRLLDLGNWSAEKYVISRPAFDEEMLEELLDEKKSDSRGKDEHED